MSLTMQRNTPEYMQWSLDWFKKHFPKSRLVRLYELAVEKGAIVSLDSMWRMDYKGQYYDANGVGEFIKILEKD